jgi:hypothetical protein
LLSQKPSRFDFSADAALTGRAQRASQKSTTEKNGYLIRISALLKECDHLKVIASDRIFFQCAQR